MFIEQHLGKEKKRVQERIIWKKWRNAQRKM